ncbi:MAG: PD40 domain-containing protein [Chloroflexi bacterium]|nr:PD40 domain-containing protein [Chloroflexota bacterium]
MTKTLFTSILTVLLFVSLNIVEAQGQSAEGKIAFSSDRDGNFEIYVMDADGTNLRRLTNNSVRDYDPAWSPDATKIAFDRYWPGDGEIHVMNADGTNEIQLTHNTVLDYLPAWSPDGTKIAFVSARDGDYEIYVMNADGNNQTRITYNPGGDWAPDWSPDGKQITFMAGDAAEIYVMNADGSGRTRLTYATGNDYTPKWSPDGAKILFASYRDGNWEIYVMNADGGNQTRLTSNSADDADPVWSPDGSKIAFSSTRDGNWKIYVMNADGSDQTRLTTGPGADYRLSWSHRVNLPPTAQIRVTPPVAAVGSDFLFDASASNDHDGTIVSYEWSFGDGTTTEGTSTTHYYTEAGVYQILLTVTDNLGLQATDDALVVVYNPDGGYVTGGGWINSPVGAFPTNPSLVGKANFGFVSKYQKGANTPSGQTEFQFKVADLNFHSDAYEWLVVSGARAQYKGIGTINNVGQYGFMLTAIDGEISGGSGVDKFRIKIWDKATGDIVYDNQIGAEDTIDPVTAIAGGSIVIHKE